MRGRSGGSRVAAVQVESTSAGIGSPIKPLTTRRRSECEGRQDRQAITHEMAGWRHGPEGDPRREKAQPFRDAAGDAPRLACHTPKIPVGRRGRCLTHCGLPASRQMPRRSRFVLPAYPAAIGFGGLGLAAACRRGEGAVRAQREHLSSTSDWSKGLAQLPPTCMRDPGGTQSAVAPNLDKVLRLRASAVALVRAAAS